MSASPTTDPMTDAPLQAAIAHHQAGRHDEAEQAYLAILQARPFHALANHNLGLLAGQRGQHAAALPYLRNALSADPDESQFWLSYTGALLKTGQAAEALEIIDTLIGRGLDTAAAQTLRQAALADLQAQRQQPSAQEEQQVAALYQAGDYAALEQASLALVQKYPNAGFAWSVLGTALQVQGKDALAVLERTVLLAPGDAEAHGNLGNALQGAGRHAEAVDNYQRALALAPDFAAAHSNLGGALQALGLQAEAIDSYRRALALQPQHAMAHFNLANALVAQGEFDAAIASYQAVLTLAPDDITTHLNLGAAQRALDLYEQAAATYRAILARQPDHAEAHSMLGVSLQGLHQPEAALAAHQRAYALDPQRAETCANIGLIEQQLGRFEAAVLSYQRVLELEPDSALIHTNLGVALHKLGRIEEATASHRRAVACDPAFAMAHTNLGATLQAQGQLDAALDSYDAALALQADFAMANFNKITVLQLLGRHADAIVLCQHMLEATPNDATLHFNLGNSLRAVSRSAEGMASYRRALALRPDYADAYANLGVALQEGGLVDEGLAASRRAMELGPQLGHVGSNLMFIMAHSTVVSAAELAAEHRRVGAAIEAPHRAHWPVHGNTREPLRRLRVGFVSGDFNAHAVANFAVPVLAHLAKHPGLSLYGYANSSVSDLVTERIRGYLPQWRVVTHHSDAALAQLIQDDAIDILFDMSGHTAKNRLATFARKPAPLQCSWIGYPGSTGLEAMDYYISDHLFSPPGVLDDQFTEKLACLPANVPFLPPGGMPDVAPAPILANGYITFGSFNRPSKLNRQMVTRWARLMQALPNSRMLLAAMPADEFPDVLRGWFGAEGVAPERLSFAPRSGLYAYFDLHQGVDVCLDSFPYTGGTTTMNALWMGVPTLTMTGTTLPSFSGACIMQHVGLDAFVAVDDNDFIEKGRFIAAQPLLLATLRLGMRRRMEQSPMGQPKVIADGMAFALREMWRRWCAGLPAAPFQVSADPGQGDDASPGDDAGHASATTEQPA